MKNNINFIWCVFAIILCQSCSRTMYTPNMHNVPLMKEKKEAQATVTLSNFQASYGLIDGLGVMLNGHIPRKDSWTELTEDRSAKKYFIEAGIGHFQRIGDMGVFEIYGGGGMGKIAFDNRNGMTMDKFSTEYSRYFLQPSFGISNEVVELAFALRFVNLRFYNVDDSEYVFNGSNTFGEDLSKIDQSTYSFVEPSVTFRVGWKFAKFQFQIARARQINFAPIDFRKVEYNFGVHINIAKRHLETNEEVF
ncbi:MAG: hypothetical protein P1U56_07730 [Saprospiraceae bacterium]|nr:hypothetical protein [Saprospiraceae bacterium]